MSRAVSIDIVGTADLQDRFDRMPAAVRQALLVKVTKLTLQLEAHIKNDKLSGQVLNARTGRLRRSITSEVRDQGDVITGRAFSSGDVPYAGIQEFGGKTAAHDIVAKKGKALAFMQGGKMAFYRRIRHPGSFIPERSYMRSSLDDMREQIVSEMRQAVIEAVRQ